MPTALITHPACLEHDTGPYHPECPDRLRAVLARAGGARNSPTCCASRRRTPPPSNSPACIRPNYVEAILAIRPDRGEMVQLDADTAMSAGSAEAALRAAGAAVAGGGCGDGGLGARRLRRRPPARPPRRTVAADGLLPVQQCRRRGPARARRAGACSASRWWISTCITATARRRCSRPMPDLFYASSHQIPCYPGTGEAWERGVANNIVNAPLRARFGRRRVPRRLVGHDPAGARSLRAGLLIVSAGFDAHKADPLAQLRLETADFAWITRELLRDRRSALRRTPGLGAGRRLRPGGAGRLGRGPCAGLMQA